MSKKKKLEAGLSNLFSSPNSGEVPEHSEQNTGGKNPRSGEDAGVKKTKAKAKKKPLKKKAAVVATGKVSEAAVDVPLAENKLKGKAVRRKRKVPGKEPTSKKTKDIAGERLGASIEKDVDRILAATAAVDIPGPGEEPAEDARINRELLSSKRQDAGVLEKTESESSPTRTDSSGLAQTSARNAARESVEIYVQRIVVFELGNISFGTDVFSVLTIIKKLPICPLPHMPDYISGLINLRGQIVPVLDLGMRLGLGECPETDEMRIVVVEREKRHFGLIVDAVSAVEEIPVDRIRPPAQIMSSVRKEYLKGIADMDGKLVLLLDLEHLLSR